MNQSKPICPVCEHRSEKKYRCSNCGKLLEESNGDYGRSVLGDSQ